LPFTPQEITDLPNVFSAPRFATYLQAKNNVPEDALALYQWNLELSAAFIVPLQICEVAVRNSIADALEMVHGPNWPRSNGLIRRLPNPQRRFSPTTELLNVSRMQPTTGKVVAELKFVFWESMLTATHDNDLWNPHFRTVFPHTDAGKSVQQLRHEAHDQVFKIRKFRNRIAHHEPIFVRNIAEEYDRIKTVIGWKCQTAAGWLDRVQTITALNQNRP
tara:strand:- start:1499 stop:2155 length:657 start_codon:yes stop_codon:yes gene_type:complete